MGVAAESVISENTYFLKREELQPTGCGWNIAEDAKIAVKRDQNYFSKVHDTWYGAPSVGAVLCA